MAANDSIDIPSNVKDITGKKCGKLTAISYAGSNLGSQAGAYWMFRCECGTEKIISGRAVRTGNVQTCGCSKHRTNEVGNVYGKLTVLEFAGNTKGGDSRWKCQCECGNTTVVDRASLRKGYGGIKSCGCGRASAGGACSGRKRSPEYISWQEMKRRCYNPKTPYYEIYGGRGIIVCQRWLDAFVNFLEDMGRKPFPEATVHRINGDGNYEPSNCKWASKEEQALHTSKTRQITYIGETMSLRGWARRFGITHRTLSVRLAKGWPLEKVFSSEHFLVPPPKKKPKPK